MRWQPLPRFASESEPDLPFVLDRPATLTTVAIVTPLDAAEKKRREELLGGSVPEAGVLDPGARRRAASTSQEATR